MCFKNHNESFCVFLVVFIGLYFVKCSGPPRLCEHQEKFNFLVAKKGGTVNLTVCILAPIGTLQPNVYYKVERNRTAVNKFNLIKITVIEDLQNIITFGVQSVDEADEGNYTVSVKIQQQSIANSFTILVEKPLTLCNNTINNTFFDVKVGENVVIPICVHTSGLVSRVTINGKQMAITDSGDAVNPGAVHLERHHDQQLVNLRLVICKVTLHSIQSYKVRVETKLNHSLMYVFSLHLLGALKVCEGGSNNLTVSAFIRSTAVVHLCVTSDIGLNSYIGVNNTSYPINDFHGNSDKLRVTSHKRDGGAMTDHYIQLYLLNVTEDDLLTYIVQIKPVFNISLRFTVNLVSMKDPRWCDNFQPMMYLITELGQSVTMVICLLTRKEVKNIHSISVKRWNNYIISNIGNQYTVHPNIDEKENKHWVTVRIVNVTKESFSRYDLVLIFHGNRTWHHIFYLVDKEDLIQCPFYACPKSPFDTLPHDKEVSKLCFLPFGGLADEIVINYEVFRIREYEEKLLRKQSSQNNIEVFRIWSQITSRVCVIIEIDKVKGHEFNLMNISLMNSSVAYRYGWNVTLSTTIHDVYKVQELEIISSNHNQTATSKAENEASTEQSSIAEQTTMMIIMSVLLAVISFLGFSFLVVFTVCKGRHKLEKRKVNIAKQQVKLPPTLTDEPLSLDLRRHQQCLNTTDSSLYTERSVLSSYDLRTESSLMNTSSGVSTMSADRSS